jgi:hypothetical protein
MFSTYQVYVRRSKKVSSKIRISMEHQVKKQGRTLVGLQGRPKAGEHLRKVDHNRVRIVRIEASLTEIQREEITR